MLKYLQFFLFIYGLCKLKHKINIFVMLNALIEKNKITEEEMFLLALFCMHNFWSSIMYG